MLSKFCWHCLVVNTVHHVWLEEKNLFSRSLLVTALISIVLMDILSYSQCLSFSCSCNWMFIVLYWFLTVEVIDTQSFAMSSSQLQLQSDFTCGLSFRQLKLQSTLQSTHTPSAHAAIAEHAHTQLAHGTRNCWTHTPTHANNHWTKAITKASQAVVGTISLSWAEHPPPHTLKRHKRHRQSSKTSLKIHWNRPCFWVRVFL